MNSRWLISLPLVLVGFGLGFFQSTTSAPRGPLPPRSERANSGNTERSTRAARTNPTPPLNLKQQIGLACEEASYIHRTHSLLALFERLSAEELERAATILLTVREDLRDDAFPTLFACWVIIDPKGAAAFTIRQGNYRISESLVNEWAAVDLPAVVDWVRQLGSEGSSLVSTLSLHIEQFMQSDPAQAVNLFLTLPEYGGSGRREVWKTWAKENPAAALSRARTEQNIRVRAEGTSAVAEGWAAANPKQAFAWFQQLTDDVIRREAAPGLIAGLATKNSSFALEVARSLPPGPERDRGFTAVASAIFFSDRATAADIITDVSLDPANKDLRDYYFQWSLNDTGAAMRALLARAARSGEDRAATEAFINADSNVTASTEPEAKVAALAEVEDAPPDDFRRIMLEKGVAAWAERDLAKARVWAESLPDGSIRDRAFAGLVEGWTWTSMNEVTSWIDGLPPSSSRDAAVGGLARTVLPRDAAGAIAWMRTISDAEQRGRVLQEAWQQWTKSDREQAEQWRSTSPDLTPTERASLAALTR